MHIHRNSIVCLRNLGSALSRKWISQEVRTCHIGQSWDNDAEKETVPENHEERIRQWTEKTRDDVSGEDIDVGDREDIHVVNCTLKSKI